MKPLKTAVIGLGRIGWSYHCPQLTKHEGYALTAVMDRSPERLDEAERAYGIRTYQDFDRLLESEAIDLAVIASPTIFHKEQAIRAMERGVDVLLEKPMAGSLEEVDAILEAMEKHGRKLMVFQPHRTYAEFLAAKSIVDGGKLGRVFMMKRASSGYVRRNDWQSMKKYGGGMLNNYGAHFIDQLLCLAGSEAKRISCGMKRIATLGDAEDVVKLVIETGNDVTLDLDINMAAAVPLPPWTILGQYGSANLEYTEQGARFVVRYVKPEELPNLSVHQELAAPGRTYDNGDRLVWHEESVRVDEFPPLNFYEQCFDYFARGGPSFVAVEQTREVMRIIEECRKQNERVESPALA
ncbi:Gfo/Idh/MocA family oxidoreductase [Paenibacillus sp.]|uniref:Gfo/Idh/MocA family protein n=1 Tax=Paenibacillus sp. TaxID=58172 RepID=UPI0028123067|nr:Gfo/Idh/MocA family oxidoreductase [Paenibacillus sp.]